MTYPRYLLTIPEAARVLGVARSTASQWAAGDAFPVEVVTISGRRFVRGADLASFLRISIEDVEAQVVIAKRKHDTVPLEVAVREILGGDG